MSYHNCDFRVVEITTLCFCVAAIFLVTEMMHVTLETINSGAERGAGGQFVPWPRPKRGPKIILKNFLTCLF